MLWTPVPAFQQTSPSIPFGFIHMRASADQYPTPEIPVLPPQPK